MGSQRKIECVSSALPQASSYHIAVYFRAVIEAQSSKRAQRRYTREHAHQEAQRIEVIRNEAAAHRFPFDLPLPPDVLVVRRIDADEPLVLVRIREGSLWRGHRVGLPGVVEVAAPPRGQPLLLNGVLRIEKKESVRKRHVRSLDYDACSLDSDARNADGKLRFEGRRCSSVCLQGVLRAGARLCST